MNKTFHIGNLTRDPELRNTSTGKSIASFSLAVQDSKETIFLDFEAWEKTAELVCKYKKKGESLAVEGRLKVDSWQDKDTQKKRTKLVIVAERIEFIGGAKGGENNAAPASKQTKEAGPIQEEESDVPF